MQNLRNTKYIRREWLNDQDSPSTGNVVAYDGELLDYDNKSHHSTFFRVSDCHVTANIHKASYDTDDDFINKMKRIRSVLDDFIHHLEHKN